MTSNIGFAIHYGGRISEAPATGYDALRAHFRPEFLNRVDEIIIFDRLSEEELKKIVEIQLGPLIEASGATKNHAQLSMPLRHCSRAKATTPFTAPTLASRHSKRNSRSLSIDILEGKVREGQTVYVDARTARSNFA